MESNNHNQKDIEDLINNSLSFDELSSYEVDLIMNYAVDRLAPDGIGDMSVIERCVDYYYKNDTSFKDAVERVREIVEKRLPVCCGESGRKEERCSEACAQGCDEGRAEFCGDRDKDEDSDGEDNSCRQSSCSRGRVRSHGRGRALAG